MPQIDKTCNFCGKEYSVHLYRVNSSKFCSRLCKTNSTKGVPSDIPPQRREQMSQVMKDNWKNGKFKSRKPWNTGTTGIVKIWNKGLKGYLCKEKHYNWKGGRTRSQWKKENKDKVNHSTRLRRFKLGGSNGTHSLKEWNDLKEKYNYMCLCCGVKEPDIILTEDHIVPIFLNGDNTIENIQPLCRSCNSKKGIKIINFKKQMEDQLKKKIEEIEANFKKIQEEEVKVKQQLEQIMQEEIRLQGEYRAVQSLMPETGEQAVTEEIK